MHKTNPNPELTIGNKRVPTDSIKPTRLSFFPVSISSESIETFDIELDFRLWEADVDRWVTDELENCFLFGDPVSTGSLCILLTSIVLLLFLITDGSFTSPFDVGILFSSLLLLCLGAVAAPGGGAWPFLAALKAANGQLMVTEFMYIFNNCFTVNIVRTH